MSIYRSLILATSGKLENREARVSSKFDTVRTLIGVYTILANTGGSLLVTFLPSTGILGLGGGPVGPDITFTSLDNARMDGS